MLEKNTSTFFEEDMKELAGLKLTEVTVFSGLTTELAPAAPGGRRTFGFIHHNFKVKLFPSHSNYVSIFYAAVL